MIPTMPRLMKRWVFAGATFAAATTSASAWRLQSISPELLAVVVGWLLALSAVLYVERLRVVAALVSSTLTVGATTLVEPHTCVMLFVLLVVVTGVTMGLASGLALIGFTSTSILGLRWLADTPEQSFAGPPFAAQVLLIVVVVLAIRAVLVERMRADQLASQLTLRNRELSACNRELDRLAVGAERARMAQDLHDRLGHTLATLGVYLRVLRERLGETEPATAEALDRVQGATARGMAELRECVGLLRATTRDAQPLERAVRALADALPEHPRIQVTTEGAPVLLPPEREVALFRVVQEALTNALKHAQADTVHVALRYTADRVSVVVHDDGRGCSPVVEGMGLTGMRERMRSFGGHLIVEGTLEPEGFRISATMPQSSRT